MTMESLQTANESLWVETMTVTLVRQTMTMSNSDNYKVASIIYKHATILIDSY